MIDNEKRLEVLLHTRNDCRQEIEMRISQRDTFGIQYLVSLGALIGFGLNVDFKYASLLFLLIPLVSFYFTTQIIYSYSIHDRLHNFLVKHIEPEISKILELNDVEKIGLLWESYCEFDSRRKSIKTPGIRKKFFEITSWI